MKNITFTREHLTRNLDISEDATISLTLSYTEELFSETGGSQQGRYLGVWSMGTNASVTATYIKDDGDVGGPSKGFGLRVESSVIDGAVTYETRYVSLIPEGGGQNVSFEDLPDITDSAGQVVRTNGFGPPEGVLSAPVGSTYTDLDQTRGALTWIKRRGRGAYGWGVTYGNVSGLAEGEFNVTPLNGWTGSLYFARTDSMGCVQGTLNGTDATETLAMYLPPGLRPLLNVTVNGTWTDSDGGSGRVRLTSEGALLVYEASGAVSLGLPFPCVDMWPLDNNQHTQVWGWSHEYSHTPGEVVAFNGGQYEANRWIYGGLTYPSHDEYSWTLVQ